MSDPDTKLSEWLELMLGEIARKRDEAAAARAESARREQGAHEPVPPPPVR
ncbi:MAG: hypothetical protein KF790_03120 [Steroidobacteraceae bacterium]|nr:hypothetical protein [Steroidobacteraceae bacterium]MCW5572574.1 hypothetical protein [Steroidobacteraceae bacterium]